MTPVKKPGKKSEQDNKTESGTKPKKKDNANNEKFSPGEPDDYDAEEFATD